MELQRREEANYRLRPPLGGFGQRVVLGEVEVRSDVEASARPHEFPALNQIGQDLAGHVQVPRSNDLRPSEIEDAGVAVLHIAILP